MQQCRERRRLLHAIGSHAGVDVEQLLQAWNRVAVVYEWPEIYRGVSLTEVVLLGLGLAAMRRARPRSSWEQGFLVSYDLYERMSPLSANERFLVALTAAKRVLELDERFLWPTHRLLSRLAIRSMSLFLGLGAQTKLRRRLLLHAIWSLQLHLWDRSMPLWPVAPSNQLAVVNADDKLVRCIAAVLGRRLEVLDFECVVEIGGVGGSSSSSSTIIGIASAPRMSRHMLLQLHPPHPLPAAVQAAATAPVARAPIQPPPRQHENKNTTHGTNETETNHDDEQENEPSLGENETQTEPETAGETETKTIIITTAPTATPEIPLKNIDTQAI